MNLTFNYFWINSYTYTPFLVYIGTYTFFQKYPTRILTKEGLKFRCMEVYKCMRGGMVARTHRGERHTRSRKEGEGGERRPNTARAFFFFSGFVVEG